MIARVIVDIKHENVNQLYDYFISPEQRNLVKIGVRVIVPFSNNDLDRVGYVIDIIDDSINATKYIKEVLDFDAVIDEESFKIAEKMLETPSNLIASTFETVIPNEFLMHYQKQVKLLKPDYDFELKEKFNQSNKWVLKVKDHIYLPKLKIYEKNEILKIETILTPKVKKKYIKYIKLIDFSYKGNEQQNKIIQSLSENNKIERSVLLKNNSLSSLNTLIKNKVVSEYLDELRFEGTNTNNINIKIDLEENLNIFLNSVIKKNYKHSLFLLESNNVEAFNFNLKLINEFIILNKQVLILVPEKDQINYYKKQLSNYYDERLISVINSTDSKNIRYINQEAILNNETSILIGARSSVFTRFSNLGLIIMTDSHDESYIAKEGTYYDTFEIANLRSQLNHIPLVLETHIPSIREAKMIESNELKYFKVEENYNLKIEIIDMANELKEGNLSMISRELKTSLDKTINENKKAMLILNQKGFSSFVMCRNCSYVPKDPDTNISLNYIEKTKKLRSNLTKYEEDFKKECPICGKPTLKPVGSGIEKLEQYIQKNYPKIKYIKIDKDEMQTDDVYDFIEDQIKDTDLIIGTQMALKSVLSNKIELVAVLMADQWLKLPIYNASAQAFELLSNAKNIAKNKFIMQTYDPKHYVINAVKNGSENYYKKELIARKIMNMPPYINIIQILIEGDSYLRTYQFAHKVKIEGEILGYTVVGPTSSLIVKNDNKYRVLLLVKYKKLNEDFILFLKHQNDYKIKYAPFLKWY